MFLKRVAVLILAGLVMTASLAACDEEETSGKDDSENVGAEADDEEKEGKVKVPPCGWRRGIPGGPAGAQTPGQRRCR